MRQPCPHYDHSRRQERLARFVTVGPTLHFDSPKPAGLQATASSKSRGRSGEWGAWEEGLTAWEARLSHPDGALWVSGCCRHRDTCIAHLCGAGRADTFRHRDRTCRRVPQEPRSVPDRTSRSSAWHVPAPHGSGVSVVHNSHTCEARAGATGGLRQPPETCGLPESCHTAQGSPRLLELMAAPDGSVGGGR